MASAPLKANVSQSRTIVVFEDDAVIADAIAETLSNGGFEPEVFGDLDGVDRIGAAVPLLVLLDVSLGRSDAVEVLQALETRGYTGPVQLMSGARAELLEEIKRIGARRGMTMLPVLPKPFAMDVLLDVAERLVATNRRRGRSKAISLAPSSSRRVDLATALDRGWAEIWYQPKYDMRTLALVGAECLTRLRHPVDGLVMPGAFLPDATDVDMRRLTEFVLHGACRDWLLFERAGLGLRLAINIPCQLLTTMPLARLLRQWCPTSPAWPGLLMEITEEQALKDTDAAHEIGTQLKIYGIDLAIDDFGLGYSSLARLSEIPFREIKLDRTLVDGCATDRTRAALCRAVVELSRTFGAKTVAEGVEREEDLACLREIGCDIAQGFLLGRPMSREALISEILTRRDVESRGGTSAARRVA